MGIPAALKISFHLNESVNYSSNSCFIKMKFAQNNNSYKKVHKLGWNRVFRTVWKERGNVFDTTFLWH